MPLRLQAVPLPHVQEKIRNQTAADVGAADDGPGAMGRARCLSRPAQHPRRADQGHTLHSGRRVERQNRAQGLPHWDCTLQQRRRGQCHREVPALVLRVEQDGHVHADTGPLVPGRA
eukprot:3934405-Rhodomonas_salina.3